MSYGNPLANFLEFDCSPTTCHSPAIALVFFALSAARLRRMAEQAIKLEP